MLTKRCGEVAKEALVLEEDVEVGTIKDEKRPIFYKKDGELFLIVPEGLPDDIKVSKVGIKVPLLRADDKLYIAARKMAELGVKALPVKVEDKILAITSRQIIAAIEDTKELAKREARVVMTPVAVIRFERAYNAENIAHKSGIPIVPLVNAKNKLVGVWFNGKVMKRVPTVKEGTRVKLVCRKLEKNPFVVVINKQREPRGIIREDELLDLAASYREYHAPVFYSGLELLSTMESVNIKELVDETLAKIARMVPIHYAAVRVTKRGIWKVNIRVSTRWRMFLSAREGEDLISITNDALEALLEQVRREKEIRFKLRGV